MPMIFPHRYDALLSLPFYVTGIGIDHIQEVIHRPQGYPAYHWIQVQSGEGRLTMASGSRSAGPGKGMLLLPDELHAYRAIRGTWVVSWFTFSGSGAESFVANSPFKKSGVYEVNEPGLTMDRIRTLYAECMRGGISAATQSSVMLYEILARLSIGASVPGREPEQQTHLRLGPVLDYIEQHFRDPLALGTLGEIIGVSHQHLCRIFKRHMGISPGEHLIDIRMRRSKNLLLNRPELRIHEVAEMVGISDANFFTRQFKSREGLSPREFRTLHGY